MEGTLNAQVMITKQRTSDLIRKFHGFKGRYSKCSSSKNSFPNIGDNFMSQWIDMKEDELFPSYNANRLKTKNAGKSTLLNVLTVLTVLTVLAVLTVLIVLTVLTVLTVCVD